MKHYRSVPPILSFSCDSFVVFYPPRDEVQSRYRLQIDVKAANDSEAAELARVIAERLLTSLTLVVPGKRYHAELRKLRRAGEIQEFSSYSETVTAVSLPDPQNFDGGDTEAALRIMDVIQGDSAAENAYVHLLSAWKLQTTSGSKPLQRSILQHYVLCMEAIVNETMKDLRKERSDQIRLSERRFASEFCSELPSRADKPKAIRDASTKLREISFQNMLPSISEIAPSLRLSDEDAQAAKDLYRFRSQNLSHPGRSQANELAEWLRPNPVKGEICLADHVARTFLKRYCEYALRKPKRVK